MADDTTITTKEIITDTKTVGPNPASLDSSLMGISIRAWIVVMCVGTACFTHLSVTIGVLIDAIFFAKDWSKVGTYTNISEPLYGCIMITIGFFFGQKTNNGK